jgi:hypothetical protein
VRPFCSVTSTIELMTRRVTGTTSVILGEVASVYDGDYLGDDIYHHTGHDEAADHLGHRTESAEARSLMRDNVRLWTIQTD